MQRKQSEAMKHKSTSQQGIPMLRRLFSYLPMLALSLSSALAFAGDVCPASKNSIRFFDAAALHTAAGRQQLARDRACGYRIQFLPSPGQTPKPVVAIGKHSTGNAKKTKAHPNLSNAFGLTQFTVLYNFAGKPDGNNPNGLFQDASGNLYGTTESGGQNDPQNGGDGTFFEISPVSGGSVTENVLYSFGKTSTDGIEPGAGLAQDASGNFYSTTVWGGASGGGTVFELSSGSDGTWNESILFDGSGLSFTTPVFDSAGNLYDTGFTFDSNFNESNTVFELSPVSGGTWKFSPLITVPGVAENYGTQARDGAGNVYGTVAWENGYAGCGWIFKVDAAGNYTDLYDFGAAGDNPQDCNPSGAPVLDANGNLYGTTLGTYLSGTVWKLSPAPAGGVCPSGTIPGNGWCENVLYVFKGESDGASPWAGVTLDAAGNLFGMTSEAGVGQGTEGYGTLFELSPNATSPTILHGFLASEGGAYGPGVLLGQDGDLYGANSYDSNTGAGTVWGYPLSTPEYPLSVTIAGSGSVVENNLSVHPGGVNCPAFICAASYNSGELVTLTATPATGYVFGGWSGACSGNANSCTVAISAAASVTANFNSPTSQTITFTANAPANAAYGTSFPVAATASSGLTVSFTAGGVCTVVDNGNGTATYTMTGSTGACSVIANQAGNSQWQPAPTVTESVGASKANQTITVITPAPAQAANSFPVVASATSGLTVTFGVGSGNACTYIDHGNGSATYTMDVTKGTCTVIMNQAGNGNYLPAPAVTEAVTAEKSKKPTVSFTGAPSNATYETSFSVAASSNSSSTPIITATGACTVSGNTVTMTSGTGMCELKASWAADVIYSAATATQKTKAEKLGSTIIWATPGAITHGTPLSATQLNATAADANNNSIAGKFVYSPAGGKVLAAGTQTLSVKFIPTMGADYTSATGTVQLVVNPIGTTTTITASNHNPSKVNQAVTIDFTVAGYKPTGSVTVNATTGESCTGNVASATGNGHCMITFTTLGARTLTAGYPGDANNQGSTSGSFMQTVN
jgi:hypothetical protein